VDRATKNQVPISIGLVVDKGRKIDGRGRYGFGWWVNAVGPEGTRRFPDAPESLYWASGFNDNVCFVIPDWNMVIVRMGTEGRPSNSYEIWNNFFKKFREAIE
jgi:hypothetical protein